MARRLISGLHHRPMVRRTLVTHAPAANLLIRLMVGGIFFFEGLQKFLYPADAKLSRQ